MLRDHQDDSGRFSELGEQLHLPVRPFEWPWDVDETIWPCRHCAVWRAELILEGAGEAIWIREWHAADCAAWAEIEGLDA